MKRSSEYGGFVFFLQFLLVDFQLVVKEFLVQFWGVEVNVRFQFEAVDVGDIVKGNLLLVHFEASFCEFTEWLPALAFHLSDGFKVVVFAGLWLGDRVRFKVFF